MDPLCPVDNTPLNQPQHADNKFVKSPASVGLIALGIIFIIGGAVTAGMLYSHLGYSSLSCLGVVPLGIALIIGGIYCGKTAARSSTIRSGHTEAMVDETAPSTNSTEGSQGNNSNILSIGSQTARLNEDSIREELRKVNKRQGVEVLIIYGDGNVELNMDPGFVALNPKKVILVGARIVHESYTGTGLDERLIRKKEWLSSNTRRPLGKVGRYDPTTKVGRYDPTTFVKQLIVDSIDEALAHEPPSRGCFKGLYHLVYQVKEKADLAPAL